MHLVETQISRGAEALVKAALQGGINQLVALPQPLVRVVGTVAPAKEHVSTEMEGETWHLGLFMRRTASVLGETVPILFRPNAVRYPLELLELIRSPVTVLAESRQIPIRSGNHEWRRSLLARAIGYIPT